MLIEKRKKEDGAKWEEISFDNYIDDVFDDINDKDYLDSEIDHNCAHRDILFFAIKLSWERKYETDQAEYRII